LGEPTAVTYVAGRSPDVNGNVEVRLDSTLNLAATSFFGLRAQPFDWLGLSLVYRDTQASQADVPQTTTAGGIRDADRVRFFEMWDPASVVIGAHVTPRPKLALSLDVAWHKWSDFRNGFNQPLSAPYQLRDTVSVASGVEGLVGRELRLRGGIGLEPSPIPSQTGVTNYLGANTLVLALGAGIDFRPVHHLPFTIDAHVRARIDAAESATKDANAITTTNASIGATQIDNMGYPGFRSQALMLQAGVTATFFIGGAK
jgi:hypothetical protein